MTNYIYIPPIHHYEESIISSSAPYFFEFDGNIINLGLVSEFHIEHFFGYTPKAKIGSRYYTIGPKFETRKDAMNYIKDIIKQVEERNRK